jgi:mRNA interferase MazF
VVVRQGEVYWINLPESKKKSEPGFCRPCVVVQNDTFNRSRIRTTIICILTTNLDLAKAPGNVALEKGEANLLKASVVNISQNINCR